MGKFDVSAQVEIDDYDIVDYVQKKFYPEDIFPEKELKQWASQNGYIHESEVKND